jgi:hypothetical protein
MSLKRSNSPKTDKSISELEKLNDLFRYEGFNPIVMRGILQNIEPSPDILGRDVKALCFLAVTRGVIMSKIIRKMKPQGVSMVRALETKYNIVSGKPMGANDVTLSRITASYPEICAMIFKEGFGRLVGDKPKGLPVWLCFPSGGSIIPSNYVETIEKWKLWRSNFSGVIKANNGQVNYDEIVIRSALFSNQQRVKILRDLGKEDDDNMLTDSGEES